MLPDWYEEDDDMTCWTRQVQVVPPPRGTVPSDEGPGRWTAGPVRRFGSLPSPAVRLLRKHVEFVMSSPIRVVCLRVSSVSKMSEARASGKEDPVHRRCHWPGRQQSARCERHTVSWDDAVNHWTSILDVHQMSHATRHSLPTMPTSIDPDLISLMTNNQRRSRGCSMRQKRRQSTN